MDALAEQRSYKNRDEITVSPTTLPNYEEKVKGFFHEHLHEDEEIRYIRDGAGFFDLRGVDDEWVRIALEKDDLLVMPAGTSFWRVCRGVFWGRVEANAWQVSITVSLPIAAT